MCCCITRNIEKLVSSFYLRNNSKICVVVSCGLLYCYVHAGYKPRIPYMSIYSSPSRLIVGMASSFLAKTAVTIKVLDVKRDSTYRNPLHPNMYRCCNFFASCGRFSFISAFIIEKQKFLPMFFVVDSLLTFFILIIMINLKKFTSIVLLIFEHDALWSNCRKFNNNYLCMLKVLCRDSSHPAFHHVLRPYILFSVNMSFSFLWILWLVF